MELEPQFDLEKEFNHNRVWFFAILGAMGLTSFVESAVSAGTSRLNFGSAFPLVVVLLCIGGIVLRSKWAQLLVASTFLATLLCYIGFVFLKL